MKKGIFIALIAATLLGAGAVSCSRFIYDDVREDCSVSVRFRYDFNMKYADAFMNEIKDVTLFVFNPVTGAFVTKAFDTVDQSLDTYYMTIPGLQQGVYDLVAWCGLPESLFSVNDPATKEDLFCSIRTLTKAGQYIDQDLRPLYYGYAGNVDLELLPPGSVNVVTIPLIKNTNHVRVLLQALNNNEQLLPDDYDFVIRDQNAVLDWNDEIPSPATAIDYLPWDVRQGTVEYEDDNTRLTAVVAEFTLNRLFKRVTDKTLLQIVDKTNGKVVISIPLVDYFLLVKGNYNRKMTDQEYLDRQDDYQITFFIDNRHGWAIAAGILINGWQVVLQNTDL